MKNATHNWPVKKRLLNLCVVSDTGCWIWIGEKNKFGYGRISVLGKRKPAHRVSYELHIGPIADGMDILHRCDIPACINPDHLFTGTHADNMRDMVSKGRNAVRCGSDNPASKLSVDAVAEIRAAIRDRSLGRGRPRTGDSSITVSSLAKRFGVSRRAIRFAILGTTWRNS